MRSALVIGAIFAVMSVSTVTAAGRQTRPALRAFEDVLVLAARLFIARVHVHTLY